MACNVLCASAANCVTTNRFRRPYGSGDAVGTGQVLCSHGDYGTDGTRVGIRVALIGLAPTAVPKRPIDPIACRFKAIRVDRFCLKSPASSKRCHGKAGSERPSAEHKSNPSPLTLPKPFVNVREGPNNRRRAS